MVAEEIIERLERIEGLVTEQSKNKYILTIDEVAAFTGLSKAHIYKLTSQKKIPHYKPTGKNIYFRKDEIEEWMLRNRQATCEELEQEACSIVMRKFRALK